MCQATTWADQTDRGESAPHPTHPAAAVTGASPPPLDHGQALRRGGALGEYDDGIAAPDELPDQVMRFEVLGVGAHRRPALGNTGFDDSR